MSVVLSVKNLAFGHWDPPLLRDVNLNLTAGSLLIICGLSGHGKSAFLRLLIGLDKPTGGRITLFDQDISRMSDPEFDRLKSKVGYVFQSAALISTMTVEDNLRLPLIYHRLADEEEIRKRVDSTLEMLLIKEYRHHFPAELSAGVQKRTAMARAIITQPELILMDEPTAGLDAVSRKLIIALIENIRVVREVPMLIVTNDLLAARSLGAPIGILKDGEVLEPMVYRDLERSTEPFVQSLLAGMQG